MWFRSVISTCRFTETMISGSKELRRSTDFISLTHTHKCKVLWSIPQFIFLYLKGTSANSPLLSLPPLFLCWLPFLTPGLIRGVFFNQHLDASFHTGAPSDYLWQINRALLLSCLLPVITRTWHQTYLPPAQSISAPQAGLEQRAHLSAQPLCSVKTFGSFLIYLFPGRGERNGTQESARRWGLAVTNSFYYCSDVCLVLLWLLL